MVDDPIEITSVTPYGAPDRPPARLSSYRAKAVGFGWPVVAVLAVLASFARVFSLTIGIIDADTDTDVDTGIASSISYAVDGWGRPHVTHTAAEDFIASGVTGPRYGVLFSIAAGLVLLGWLLTLLRAPRQAWQPVGRTLCGLGCVFLLGVVACEIVATLPNRRSFPEIHQTFRFGPSPWLAGGACALGAVIWAAQFRAQRTDGVADRDVAVPAPTEPSPDPGQSHDQND